MLSAEKELTVIPTYSGTGVFAGDPRQVEFIAEMLVRFHMRIWHESGFAYDRERNAVNTSLNGKISSGVNSSPWNVEEVNNETDTI